MKKSTWRERHQKKQIDTAINTPRDYLYIGAALQFILALIDYFYFGDRGVMLIALIIFGIILLGLARLSYSNAVLAYRIALGLSIPLLLVNVLSISILGTALYVYLTRTFYKGMLAAQSLELQKSGNNLNDNILDSDMARPSHEKDLS